MITIVEDEYLGVLLNGSYTGKPKHDDMVVKKLKMRINTIKSAKNENDLRSNVALHFEKLTEKRYKDKYSIRVHGKWRLILSISKNEVTIVHVEELSDHYK